MLTYNIFNHVQPEESFSDDFLFPMTSRLSYTSAAESDGEFCGEDTPRRSAEINNARNVTSQDPSGRLVRATSDPSLARQDGTIKSEPGDHIPDYSLPPPYSTQPEVGFCFNIFSINICHVSDSAVNKAPLPWWR